MDMHVMKMTRNDFKKVPILSYKEIEKYKNIGFKKLVIIPKPCMHESGYRRMEFCMIDHKDQPIARIGGYTDVISIDGIGGHGDWNPDQGIPRMIKCKGWTMDCIPCGYLQLWIHGYDLYFTEWPISTLEIYAKKSKYERTDFHAEPERDGAGHDLA